MERKIDIYTTIQGDMWDGISFKVYGKEGYSRELLKANPRYSNTVIFSGGVELICPDISNDSDDSPPWRT